MASLDDIKGIRFEFAVRTIALVDGDKEYHGLLCGDGALFMAYEASTDLWRVTHAATGKLIRLSRFFDEAVMICGLLSREDWSTFSTRAGRAHLKARRDEVLEEVDQRLAESARHDGDDEEDQL
jgi:hypothetical protein